MEKCVLVVGAIHETGGIARWVKDMLHLDLPGVRLLHFDVTRPWREKGIRTGYASLLCSGFGFLVRAASLTIMRLAKFPFVLARDGVDVVHIAGASYWTFWENTLYILMAKLLGRKVILHYLGAFDLFYAKSSRWTRWVIAWSLRQPDFVIALSDRVRLQIAEMVGHTNHATLRSSVMLEALPEKTKPDEMSTQPVGLFMGGAGPIRKGVMEIIECLPIVLDSVPDLHLKLVGSPENMARARARAEVLGVTDSVLFSGWVDENEKRELYCHSHFLLLPSHNEGLPYVLIEAMGYGLPVIVSNVGGMPEVVEHGVNGFVIEPGDTNHLADCIIRLVSNPNLRCSMSERNREKVQSQYSLEAAKKQLQTIYAML